MNRIPIYVGYDPRESIAYQIAKFSLESRTSYPVDVKPLVQADLRAKGMYWRPTFTDGLNGQTIDAVDGRPFSSEFTFTRFLVGNLARSEGYRDWAFFVDPDFLFLADIEELIEKVGVEDVDLMCVKHEFAGTSEKKLDNKAQVSYPRKLWSSFFGVNLQAQDYHLSVDDVNRKNGRDLHTFKGCPDELIYGMDEAWNFVPGHSEERVATPKAIHYTEKSPWFKGQEDAAWGELWWSELENYKSKLRTSKRKEIWW